MWPRLMKSEHTQRCQWHGHGFNQKREKKAANKEKQFDNFQSGSREAYIANMLMIMLACSFLSAIAGYFPIESSLWTTSRADEPLAEGGDNGTFSRAQSEQIENMYKCNVELLRHDAFISHTEANESTNLELSLQYPSVMFDYINVSPCAVLGPISSVHYWPSG